MFGKFEQPVAESKYIVRVKSKEPGWVGLYYFSGMPIYPAHILKDVNGAHVHPRVERQNAAGHAARIS